MNPRELVDHIRSGPAKLVIEKPLRFRRRTRSNPCDFNDFLQALQSSETIRDVQCSSQLRLSITEDEWVLLVKTLGRIRNIRSLMLDCSSGSRRFHPFQAVADGVKNAQSVREILIGVGSETFPSDSLGLIALARALREHTGLQDFRLINICPRVEAAQTTALDPVLQALPACPHLQRVTIGNKYTTPSADAMKNLLQLAPAIKLCFLLKMNHWLAVADEIRQGRCKIKYLSLSLYPGTISDATEAVKAVASAIRLDQNLKIITLRMENGFTDDAGVALAEALTVNKTLRKITLSATLYQNVHNEVALGASTYEALSAMLRVNRSLVMKLPPFKTAGADERLLESQKQMRIEQRLNEVGSGKLLVSNQSTREEWVDALRELSARNGDDLFEVSCLYSLLQLHPDVCMLQHTDTSNNTGL
jgi:hypothetical protein